ncbi:MAG: 3-deoxy-7-phosphoheptulonate synthase [Thalassobaculum sp.]|uniref:3-deoxy-7-phosphoheptulonate synthase n=1 Tax=Thalassobaculum sp. TaxID=2022740 RepID=UPI0032EB2332
MKTVTEEIRTEAEAITPGTDDLRIAAITAISRPEDVIAELPRSDAASRTVAGARRAIHRILAGADDRLAVVIGPCSVHDPEAALEYAGRLLEQRRRFAGELEVVMRVYFEKPRTTVGWKGLINDPDLDGSFRIDKGLRLARGLLARIADSGLPAGCEFLDTATPQYFADLVGWGAIGARTTESQIHRELASGLSCPVGFKNGTDGSVKIAVDAVVSAAQPHHFLALTKSGQGAIAATTGNPDCHVILRGGNDGPNFDAASVDAACATAEKAGLRGQVMVDASHANSAKNPENQPAVIDDVARRIAAGERRIIGVMAESNLVAGRQDLEPGKPLVYGRSITDGCVDWETSVAMLERLAEAVLRGRALRGTSG